MSRAAFPPMPTPAEHSISTPPAAGDAPSSGPTTRRRVFVLGLELALLATVFAISVALRSSNLDRPLSEHHEWLTAHSLMVMQIWWEDGAWDAKFTQRMNYPRQADKYINNAAMSLYGHYLPHDAQGNFYYMSHPPMAMVVPYALLHIHKPFPEAMGSIVAGLVLGMLALKTRSIWPGLVVHGGVALAMDWFALLRSGTMAVLWQ